MLQTFNTTLWPASAFRITASAMAHFTAFYPATNTAFDMGMSKAAAGPLKRIIGSP